MPNHLCALKTTGEFLLASFANLSRDLTPHVSDDDHILECCVAAEFTEHPETPLGGSGKPTVGDAVDVDDSRELSSFLVSVEKVSPQDRETVNAGVHLRGG